MRRTFHLVKGDVISTADLKIEKARDLGLKLNANCINRAILVECLRHGENETVVFDVDVEVAQVRVHDIKSLERIAATFYPKDDIMPEVHALRTDFPRVPHINLREEEYPRSLCLYDEAYENIKLHWTAPRFVDRIREWLALTAKGNLHQEDQYPEPLISVNFGYIILPKDLGNTGESSERIYITKNPSPEGECPFYFAHRKAPAKNMSPWLASVHRGAPMVHGIINYCPANLAELANLIKPSGIDLLRELRNRFKGWLSENKNLLNYDLILVISIPNKRNEEGEIESTSTWAFVLGGKDENICVLGEKLGVWKQHEKVVGLLLDPDLKRNGEDIATGILNVSYLLSRSYSASLNGRSVANDIKIAAVGIGALGSQVIMNAARSGFGTWILIDNDHLMPHNVTRHALTSFWVGHKKAKAVSLMANDIIANQELFLDLPVDVFKPGEKAGELSNTFKKADAILDMSASVPVARMLACDVDSNARRISLFLTPSGKDLVLLAEDRERKSSLDGIEMQYYRAILHKKLLQAHLTSAKGQHRYGQSCRDITFTLSQNIVSLHSALGAMAIETAINDPNSTISIWKSDDAGNVQRVDVSTDKIDRHTVGKWTVIIDEGFIRKLHKYRNAKLPKETGGVLIGSFDLERNKLYIVDTLPSPPDSEEWPTLFIRGCKGLKKDVEDIKTKVNGMLDYVGEWHSHPKGTITAPSGDDIIAFAWLTDWMEQDGLPAVMIIVGDHGRMSLFVDEMKREENL